jgi:hypothetical protein
LKRTKSLKRYGYENPDVNVLFKKLSEITGEGLKASKDMSMENPDVNVLSQKLSEITGRTALEFA